MYNYKKAILYARVSTEEQKQSGYSLQDQERQNKRFCRDNGIEVIDSFTEAYSAKSFDRPVLSDLIKRLKAGTIKADVLIVTKTDRFSRKVEFAMKTVRELAGLGVKVHSIMDGPVAFDTTDGFFMNLIKSGMAEHENLLRGHNTKRGMRQAAREGRITFKAPIGYKNDPVTKTAIVDEEKRPLIVEAFTKMSTAMYSANEIRLQLFSKGLRCHKQKFMDMLRNKFYVGYITIPTWENEPEEQIKGVHEPLIDTETFNKVQYILANRGKKAPKRRVIVDEMHLRGFLICMRCGGRLTGGASIGRDKSKKHYYYQCQKGCPERFRADIANAQFESLLSSLVIRPEFVSLYQNILMDVFSAGDAERNKKIDSLEKEKNNINSQIDSLTLKFIADDIPKEIYKRLSAGYEERISAIGFELSSLNSQKSCFTEYMEFCIPMLSDLRKFYSSANVELKRKATGSIFSRGLIFDGVKYRTVGLNSVLELMISADKAFEEIKNKKAGKNSGLSCLAPPSGLEPETP